MNTKALGGGTDLADSRVTFFKYGYGELWVDFRSSFLNIQIFFYRLMIPDKTGNKLLECKRR